MSVLRIFTVLHQTGILFKRVSNLLSRTAVMEEVKQSSMNQKFQLISLFYSSEVWSLQHRGTQALQFIPADCRHLAEDLKLSHHPSHLQVRGERATSKGQRLIISFYQHTGLYIETSPDHQSRTGNMLKTCLFFFFFGLDLNSWLDIIRLVNMLSIILTLLYFSGLDSWWLAD